MSNDEESHQKYLDIFTKIDNSMSDKERGKWMTKNFPEVFDDLFWSKFEEEEDLNKLAKQLLKVMSPIKRKRFERLL